MRLNDLRRTTSFRLAVLFLLLFGTAAVLLCGFVFLQTRNYLVHRANESLLTEQAPFVGMGAAELRQLLTAHIAMDPHLQRPSTLFGAAGERLAGSPLGPPQFDVLTRPADRSFDFTLQRDGRPAHFLGLIRDLPGKQYLLVAQDMTGAMEFRGLLLQSCLWGGLATVVLGLVGAAVAGAGAVRRIEELHKPFSALSEATWPAACQRAGITTTSTGWRGKSTSCWPRSSA